MSEPENLQSYKNYEIMSEKCIFFFLKSMWNQINSYDELNNKEYLAQKSFKTNQQKNWKKNSESNS